MLSLLKELIDGATSFTIKGYAKLLRYLSQTYKIIPLCRLPQETAPYLALRHDVDYSPSSALRMAELEQKLGVTATYFVLFSDRFYNLHECRNVQIIRRISALGHEVGLHYDPSQYQIYDNCSEKTLKIEITLLEHLLGKKVYSIARHGPWVRDPFYAVKGYINANDPRWRGDLFIHDSLRAWTPYEALPTLLRNPPRRVQLLVHPAYWRGEEIDRKMLLDSFFDNREKENRSFKKELEKWWVKDPTALEYDARFADSKNSLIVPLAELESRPQKSECQELTSLFRWYLINTSIGWEFHKVVANTIRRLARKISYLEIKRQSD